MDEDLFRFVSEDIRAKTVTLDDLIKFAQYNEDWEPIFNDAKDNIVGFTSYFMQEYDWRTPFNCDIYKPGEEYRIVLRDREGILADYSSPRLHDVYERVRAGFQSKIDAEFKKRAAEAVDSVANYLCRRTD